MIKVWVVSLGCPKTRVDTELMLGSFKNMLLVANPEDADVALINTCSFIEPAVEESLQVIFDTARRISACEKRPILAVTGCLISRYGEALYTELPEVDIFLPIQEQHLWIEKLRTKLDCVEAEPKNQYISTPPGYAYLKISEGCNNKCKFCTIPSIRGKLRSTPPKQVIANAKYLLSKGVQELIVVAQDSTIYGKDLGIKNGLMNLINDLVCLSGLKWLRLMYLYPSGMNERLLSFLGQTGLPLLPYFDMPLQHAHSDVLKSMGRPFIVNPREIVEKIHKYIPNAYLRTTFIVGYPGETQEQFAVLSDFVKETKFHNMGVFTYYPEDGTKAAKLPNQIDDSIKQERRKILMDIQGKISRKILNSHIGEIRNVIVDSACDEWPGLYIGHTEFQAPEVDGVTYISGNGVQVGAFVSAKIEESKKYDLVALAE